MSKVLTYGPNNTPVAGVNLVFTPAALDFDKDFRLIDEGPGKAVYTDLTSPQDQPSTIRIAQTARANMYANTMIDPSVYLPSKRATDTVVEVKEVWSETESTDPALLHFGPVRCALTFTVPDSAMVTTDAVIHLVQRCVSALFAQAEATPDTGIAAILRGVVKKG